MTVKGSNKNRNDEEQSLRDGLDAIKQANASARRHFERGASALKTYLGELDDENQLDPPSTSRTGTALSERVKREDTAGVSRPADNREGASALAIGGRRLTIGDAEISDESECYVVAEIGHNHQGSLDQAIELFNEAKACGANAVKLQKRDNRSLYTREFFNKPYENENSFGPVYGEHREALEFGRAEYEELIAHAREIGITFFATAFDHPSADFLADLDMPAYKIASADLTNTPLLRYVASIGKPMIISTGAATLDDVRRAYEEVAPINRQIVLMQATASSPAAWEELGLRVIETYRELFPTVVGLSSHDNGIAMSVAAYALGARIVEKHFTLNRAMKGTDHSFSLEPQGLRKLVRDLQRVRVALGDGTKIVYQSEREPALKMGKKLVAASDLPAGHTLRAEDIAVKSPGDGLPPSELDRVVGHVLRHPVAEETALTFELLDARPGDPAEDDREVAADELAR